MKRELLEEISIEVTDYELFDANSITFPWNYKEDKILNHQHIGRFYKVNNYNDEIQKEVEIDNQNDNSLGADFYDIESLKKEELSYITILELEKLGYYL